ncbi:MAG: bifunctional aconitate hydratase 2/2-methylisocitrate dehydratase [Planctomycetota bacterium]|jgi:aconitate hydratase 2/2-methylisocitrate dehydratase|nr:bifunctional aconitate hydratase 2/2-methylisocitrate dehydratase [Planctomycetota bacterium]
MLTAWRRAREERKKLGIPPVPLTAAETKQIGVWLAEGKSSPPDGDEDLLTLLADQVPGGVDPAAKVKSGILADAAEGRARVPGLSPETAIGLLGAMGGGYNIPPLVALLDNPALAPAAVQALSGCILAGDAVDEILRLYRRGNGQAGKLLEAWAGGEWFVRAPVLPEKFPLVVYKVDGEVNTDDLSPAKQAPNRPDIPLHALYLGISRFPGGREEMERLRLAAAASGFSPVFVSDILGTGSSRKSAGNSLVWLLGRDIPHIPNRRQGGVVIASRIAPIFRDSFEDAGGLPIIADVSSLSTGDRISLELRPRSGRGAIRREDGSLAASFPFSPALADSWRAGGRINLIIGRKLAARAAAALGRKPAVLFAEPPQPSPALSQGYTLAQKLLGRACGKAGVLPGESCEPAMSTVGSQDTTGPMTRDELTGLACRKFSADLVMQSFCHTAAYPTTTDLLTHAALPGFFTERGGVALRPGDGIVHSWLNRLLVPDRVGTGGDSHTRFPLGISFAAGSGLTALAAAQGFMPLVMPESALVSFRGARAAGITLRDVVNAIPLAANRTGLLDRPGEGGGNVFNGRILEMEGLPGLTVEEAFELTCATAERSAAAATVTLEVERVADYLRSNASLVESLLADGYGDRDALARRLAAIREWLARPELLRRDGNAAFAARLEVDLDNIQEPIIACPNNPDSIALLSERAGERIDEVFIGSCMSNIGHFRAAAAILSDSGASLGVKRLWIAPPTRMDRDQLTREGVLRCFEELGARLELPGCSLCMGNQARVADGAAVFSTSTRNFANRMGAEARVYLGSAILAAAAARLGRLPAPAEYFALWREKVEPRLVEISRPLYFHLPD